MKRLKELLQELDRVSGVPKELHPGCIESAGVLTFDPYNWIHEAKQALAQLVREGDLKVERVSRGRELYFLAPIRW